MYIYHIPYYFGLFIFKKNDCSIVVALKTMVNAADNGYQGHPIRNVRTGRIICFQHGSYVCPYTLNGSLHQLREGERITYYINSLLSYLCLPCKTSKEVSQMKQAPMTLTQDLDESLAEYEPSGSQVLVSE